MAPKQKKCSPVDRSGRLSNARQFLDAALIVAEGSEGEKDLTDAYITLCVHAGIAAADVLCCARLGVHATGEDHAAAVALLQQVDVAMAKDLGTLLRTKTRAGYSSTPSPIADRRAAGRAATRLVEAAVAAG